LGNVIVRIWQGKVLAERAEEYAQYHFENGVVRIQNITGNLGVQVLRRTVGDHVEFTTISYWESKESIHRFAGDDIENPHHLLQDAEFLIELPQQIVHYELDFSDLNQVAQRDWRTIR
jgi:heme-degrading monooxygenase HmoA